MSLDDQSSVKLSFDDVNPPSFSHLVGNAVAFQSLREADEAKRKALRDWSGFVEKNRTAMINEQIRKVSEELNTPKLKPGAKFSQIDVLQEAKRRVELYIDGQFRSIEQAYQEQAQQIQKTSVPKREIAHSSVRETVAHPLSRDTHKAVDKSWDRIGQTFNKFLDAAGMKQDDPLAQRFRDHMKALQKAQHRDIGQVFNAHGITRQPVSDRSGPSLNGG